MSDKYSELKKAVEALCLKLNTFHHLSEQLDHKANQRKARLLSVQIGKEMKEFRRLSNVVDKIPER